MKKKMIIGLLVVALVLTVAVAASATTGAKQIGVTYRNIMLMVNGNVVTAQPGYGEPFIVDSEGRTYIPIRMAAEALGLNVEWVDWLNAVKITGSASTDELEALRAENESLKAQLEACQDDEDYEEEEEEEEEEDTDLGDLEDDLNSDYDELGDVAIEDISLDGDEDDVDVEIEVDLGDYEDEWDDLSDSEIESFIEDIVDDIQNEFSDDTVVEGEIVDIDSGDTLVDFSKDGEDDLEIEIEGSSDASDVEEELEGDTYDVDGVEFELSSVSYNESSEYVSARLTTDDSDSQDLSSSDLQDAADDIFDDIEQAFDDADFTVDDAEITFYDDEGDELDSFSY